MKLVFFNNNLNHHQVNVADELFTLLGDDYCYITTTIERTKAALKGGNDYSNRPYCLQAGNSRQNYKTAMELARTATVCVFGAESLVYAIERAKTNPQGLSFELGERWLKRGLINVLSPNLCKWWWAYQQYFRRANFYKLNSSAFAASDHKILHSYRGRCFKWGYFTHVDEDFDFEVSLLRIIKKLISD